MWLSASIARNVLRSISSSRLGPTPSRVTAATASPAARREGKVPTTVTGSTRGRGRSRTVALVTIPSAPSEPTNRPVRSSPATPLTVRRPVMMTLPSASTTSRPSTASRVTPYFTHRRPPALVAMLPPIVEISKLDGSGAYIRPTSAAARSRSAVTTPASTTAIWSSAESSRIRVIRVKETMSEPSVATAPPESPLPDPRGTTGMACRWAKRRAAETSCTLSASTTPSGVPGVTRWASSRR